MGKIENDTKSAIEKFAKDRNLEDLLISISHIADYSVRSVTHYGILIDSIRKYSKKYEIRDI